ncbi:Myc-type basic helix-loop-helix (bHLH) domain-containing protein [Dioscorea alata]|uniref:Myc-type basic helix-loop-helix (BHLH) domain-containing protein n=3 Tax=Dioscorea alata TaxID=55571 RepID=A0ACB7V4C1_DIOAL|nr:Myc-type basic helix-loop-helix (bHLH) domain-containing protein [Dioscorea alata]
MGSYHNLDGGWLAEYGLEDEGTLVDFIWPDATVASAILEFDVSQKMDSLLENNCTKKRARMEFSCAAPATKACREKMRRIRLNDRFAELCSILDPKKQPAKADKVAILTDANRLLHQLRLEAQKLQESNEALQVSLKNLKAEKVELRDEKVRLKSEKERMEKLLRSICIAPHPLHPVASVQAAAFTACTKALPYPTYNTPMGMWQWIPPAALDTSLDPVLRPPVA